MISRTLSAQDLLAGWCPGGGEVPHNKLQRLLALAVPGEELDAESLGMRNQRLIRLHKALGGHPLEARLDCSACGTEIEFQLPEEAILSAPQPAADAVVSITDAGRVWRFRLPRMSDMDLARTSDELLAACSVSGERPELSAVAVQALAEVFEAADPAGDISMDIECPECGLATKATADPASFVAAELDRVHAALLREVDCLARAYGWTEGEILSLPAGRRRAYMAMILDRDSKARPLSQGMRA